MWVEVGITTTCTTLVNTGLTLELEERPKAYWVLAGQLTLISIIYLLVMPQVTFPTDGFDAPVEGGKSRVESLGHLLSTLSDGTISDSSLPFLLGHARRLRELLLSSSTAATPPPPPPPGLPVTEKPRFEVLDASDILDDLASKVLLASSYSVRR